MFKNKIFFNHKSFADFFIYKLLLQNFQVSNLF